MKIPQRLLTLTAAALALVCLSGCARYQTRMMKKELQEVAKRWCLTIRASQVIPVYPLTEDLQPGDLFVVQTPIQTQVKDYTRKGFLPLDFHLHRLEGLDYESFYKDGYFEGTYATNLPNPRPRSDQKATNGSHPRFGLANVPAAAFPDYTFKAKRGLGTRLAIPINGVPVGLSFLGSSQVNGSVKITEAFTYGVNEDQLYEHMQEWAGHPDNRLLLAGIRNNSGERLFLRVISRVYLVGGVTVSLQAQGATSSGADVGAAKPVNPLTMTPEEADELLTVAETYQQATKALTGALNDSLPGGSVRFASANRGSVSMKENFDRLLVLGYLGFDVEVDSYGRLGAPVATQTLLTDKSAGRRLMPKLSAQSQAIVERQVRDIFSRILSNESEGEPYDSIRNRLNAFGDSVDVKEGLPVYVGLQDGLALDSRDIASKVEGLEGFNRYSKYRAEINKSLNALDVPDLTEAQEKHQDMLLDAGTALSEHFETSRHVDKALELYYQQVLRKP